MVVVVMAAPGLDAACNQFCEKEGREGSKEYVCCDVINSFWGIGSTGECSRFTKVPSRRTELRTHLVDALSDYHLPRLTDHAGQSSHRNTHPTLSVLWKANAAMMDVWNTRYANCPSPD
ncbi:uncharacterized protein LOC143018894 [Oratosquilla oratoria]|uniref:uncharacterized protein LOC143018894 n=1 Tax=Oratosquilla oratoria TaxID=337810 RepID=UPI003F75F2C0